MKSCARVLLLVLAISTLTACSETQSNDGIATQLPANALRSGSAQDEAACLAAVSSQTQNRDVVVLSSEFSQANTSVVVGVGPQRASWRCLVNGGRVAEVMSLTNEGSL